LLIRGNGYLYPQGELQREQGGLERETQRRPCSKAKREAAVRVLTPSLW
jgi:hypothetical protein